MFKTMMRNIHASNEEIAFGIYGAIAGLFALVTSMDPRGYFLVYSTAAMFGVMCMILRGLALKKIWSDTKSWLLVRDFSWPMAPYIIGTLAAFSKIKVP